MQVYHYHHDTGEYLGSTEARVAPLRENLPDDDLTKFLVPANATTVAPPDRIAGSVPVFGNGAWTQVADHRGEVWFKGHQQPVTILSLGEVPKGLSKDEPPPSAPTKDEINAGIIFQINELEATQHRAMREALLNVAGAKEQLRAIDNKIAALRSKFVK